MLNSVGLGHSMPTVEKWEKENKNGRGVSEFGKLVIFVLGMLLFPIAGKIGQTINEKIDVWLFRIFVFFFCYRFYR